MTSAERQFQSLGAGGAPASGAVLRRAVTRAAELLGQKRAALAEMLGVSLASAARLVRGERDIDPGSKEGELALLFVRCFRSLDAVLGGDEAAARAWFDAQNSALSGCPRELVLRVPGLVDVLRYLDAMRAKT